MRLQKTTVESASTTSPKTSPSSIVPITYNSNPNADGNWTTKTLFTCPSTALYAKIYFKASSQGGTYNYLASNSSGYYGVKFAGSMIYEGSTQTTYGNIWINTFYATTTVASFSAPRLEDNDTLFSSGQFTGIIVSGSRLILNPGEKFELTASSSSNSSSVIINAEAHIFNAT